MIEKSDDSEAFLDGLMKESVLKTPCSNFTAQIMLQIARKTEYEQLMRRQLRQQTILGSLAAVAFVFAFIYFGLNFGSAQPVYQMTNHLYSNILGVTQSILPSITVVYYMIIPIALLYALDLLFNNKRRTA